MIYLNNDSTIQQVYIPRQIINKVTTFNPDDLKDYATESWVKAQGYATKTWVENQGYADESSFEDYYTKSEVDSIVDGIGNTDLSDYYTKNEVDQLIDGAVDNFSDYYTKTEIDEKGFVDGTEIDVLEQQINDKQDELVSGVNIKTINGESVLGEGDIVIEGGGFDSNPTFDSIQVYGTATFNSEIVMAGGGQSGDSDIASGIACAFKAGKSQSIDIWTRKIHSGTDGDDIYFVTSPESAGQYTQLAKIDTQGNIYEGTTKLSDKYALKGEGGGNVDLSDYYTKTETDELIANIEIGDSGSIQQIVATEVTSQLTDNFKTINGETIIGSGNIEINADADVKVIEMNSNKEIVGQDIVDAAEVLSSGKPVLLRTSYGVFPLGGGFVNGYEYKIYANMPSDGDVYNYIRCIWAVRNNGDGNWDGVDLTQNVYPEGEIYIYQQTPFFPIYAEDGASINSTYFQQYKDSLTPVRAEFTVDDVNYKVYVTIVQNYNDRTINAYAMVGTSLYTWTCGFDEWDITITPSISSLSGGSGGGSADLTGYATETWVNEQGFAKAYEVETTYVSKTEFNTVVGNINNILSSI